MNQGRNIMHSKEIRKEKKLARIFYKILNKMRYSP